jgi:hypothetical protein
MRFVLAFLVANIFCANAFSNGVKNECWRKTNPVVIKINKSDELTLDEDLWKYTSGGKVVFKNLNGCNG